MNADLLEMVDAIEGTQHHVYSEPPPTFVIICAPRPMEIRMPVIDCPVCKRRRRMVVRAFEWYGPNITCLSCGQEWHDGESPFSYKSGWGPRSHWRQQNIERAHEIWAKRKTP